jgi:hypothetical protein
VPELLSIGRFAEITGMTAKALCLYDKMGILHALTVSAPSATARGSTCVRAW